MGLAGCGTGVDGGAAGACEARVARRLAWACSLALRRLGSAEVAQFLNDTDPRVVVEAARAIHDEPIADGDAAAGRADHAGARRTTRLFRRVLNANYRPGNARSGRGHRRISPAAPMRPKRCGWRP